ncbi:hypothetical protein Gogos_004263 [Gossypium gossypioides]|uniref:Uncharacterized protein n=1 Tax=Gossypium gossypioides TaxID=34282 RepID=A0A7J9CFR1_GOSGO|nr:hypothetical protein [Gossypium gossypioides]
MLHSTTHTSLNLSLFSCFSSMSEILANSEENWRILLKSNSNAQNQTTCLGLTLTCSLHNPDSFQ